MHDESRSREWFATKVVRHKDALSVQEIAESYNEGRCSPRSEPSACSSGYICLSLTDAFGRFDDISSPRPCRGTTRSGSPWLFPRATKPRWLAAGWLRF